jgi:hypothetical protein
MLRDNKMLSTTKTFMFLILIPSFLTACSGPGVTEEDFAALEASMEACSETLESTDSNDVAAAMGGVGNIMECATKTGDDFFLQHCGEEEVFSNVMAATMKKAFSGEGNGELTTEEVQGLVGECAAEVWQQMGSIEAKTEASS